MKTKEKGDAIRTADVDQISGHKAGYQSKYPDQFIYPLLFTNKNTVVEPAITKAKGNVRILKANVFSVLMTKYLELMEKGWKIEDPSERLAFMEQIPKLEKFEIIFKSGKQPVVSLDEINSIM